MAIYNAGSTCLVAVCCMLVQQAQACLAGQHTLASLQEVVWASSRHWAELEAAHVQQVDEVCASSCSWDG